MSSLLLSHFLLYSFYSELSIALIMFLSSSNWVIERVGVAYSLSFSHLWMLLHLAYSYIIISLLLLIQSGLCCEREIGEDICPQREGYDDDCEKRCLFEYPFRLSSGCHVRNSGTLLSFFGIRSFVCRCQLPPAFCIGGSVGLRHAFSLANLQTHSDLRKLNDDMKCPNAPTSSLLSCRDSFDYSNCRWQRSSGADWFAARGRTNLPFANGEQPVGEYLVVAARDGVPIVSLDTCNGLCSVSSMNVSARLWRAPWIQAELCFKENDAIMCAPLRTSNGKWLNEVIPRTERFQISLKFSNMSDGDVVLLDDVMTSFESCQELKREEINSIVDSALQPVRPIIHTPTSSLQTRRIMGNDRVLSGSTQRIVSVREGQAGVENDQNTNENMRRRYCNGGDCGAIIHHSPTHQVSDFDRTCIGKAGLSHCQLKCSTDTDDGLSARCVRQRIAPFRTRCVCQLRRSPMFNVGNDRGILPMERLQTLHLAESMTNQERPEKTETLMKRPPTAPPRLLDKSNVKLSSLIEESAEIKRNEIVDRSEETQTMKEEEVCALLGDHTDCVNQCKLHDGSSTGECVVTDSGLSCHCSSCSTYLCDFERGNNCGWTDLRLVSPQFNNISIAAKKNQENRYGLSRLSPRSYAGLIRKGWVAGPISLSVDVFPSEEIDVRICVDSLHRCQSQTVAARSWNRVTAKIKVGKTDKIFLLFKNGSPLEKTIAIDNISILSGLCEPRPLRMRKKL